MKEEKKISGKVLQQTASLLAATLESTADGLLVIDNSGKVTTYNQKFLSMWHIPESLAIKRDDKILLENVLSQLKDPGAFIEKVKQLYSQPEANSFDILEFKDGRVFERFSQPQRLGNETVGRVWSFRNVTDRRRVEEEQRRDRETAQRLAEETAVIAEIGRLIGSTLNIDEVYERFTAEARKLIPFDRLAVNLFNIHENTLTIAYVSGADVSNRNRGDSPPLAGTLTEEVIRGRTGLIIQPESIDEIVSRIPGLAPTFQAGLRSLLSAPLISRDEVIGVLHFRTKKPNAYKEQDLRLAERIGAQIAGALANTLLFTDLKKTEMSLRVSEERYRTLVENASDIVFRLDDTGHITFVNPAALRITGYEEKEIIGRHYPTFIRPDMQEEAMKFFGRQFVKGIPNTYSEYPIIVKDGREIWLGQNTQLIFQDGKVVAFQSVVRDITERKEMEALLRESENRYRELSIVDDLTQLYNSRHFYFQLKIELDRSNRYEQSLTLLLLDLDDFKRFNDAYGHVEGDQVLFRLGQVVKRCLRETDFAYRYGGEEFTIILPVTTSADGAVTAERIRTEFKRETFSPAPGRDVHVTVSIGLAQYRPQEEMKAFVHRVDRLMYQGKKGGKDRVCCES
jgi:diguanylate cyclase (GGDEF)-like protein/PAS domain S-box-containing protein